MLLAHALERFYAVARAIDDEAGVRQRFGDGGAERRLVFDDEHRRARRPTSAARSIGARHRRLERAGADRQLDEERRAALGSDVSVIRPPCSCTIA